MNKGKIVIISILVIAFSVTVAAQNIQPIIKGGANIANVSGDEVEDTDSKIGIVVGGLINFDINEQLAFQTGPFYSQKGYKIDEGGSEMTGSLDYLEMPFLGRYSIPMGSNIEPNIFAGPSIAYNINAEVEMDDETQDISDNVKSMDFGIILGAGVKFNQFIIDAEYNMGLSSIDDSDSDSDIKNSVITITAGYCLSL